MVTRFKPLDRAGIDAHVLRASTRAADKWLKAADYDAIIKDAFKRVPLKPGADIALLKAEIRTAAVWYIIGVKLQSLPATPARVRATFENLHDKAKDLLNVIKTFPPELRPQLRTTVGPDEQDADPLRQKAWRHRKVWRNREAWLSPLTIVEHELERLIPAAQEAAQSIPVKTRFRERAFDSAKQTAVRAWKNATGRSPLNRDEREEFVAFELAVTSRLNRHLRAPKTISTPSINGMIEAVTGK